MQQCDIIECDTFYIVAKGERGGQKKRNEEKRQWESEVWCQWGQLLVQPAARRGWNLRLAQPQDRAKGEGREKETQVWERERECPSKRKKAKYAGSKQSKPTKKCRWREENVEILTWEMKCSGANKVRVKVCVKEQWCGEERVMCLGRERKGKGVGEHALFGLSLDAGLAFLRHTQTHPGAVSTYHTPRDRKNMA